VGSSRPVVIAFGRHLRGRRLVERAVVPSFDHSTTAQRWCRDPEFDVIDELNSGTLSDADAQSLSENAAGGAPVSLGQLID
jgi:hypothetical protein